MKIKWTLATIFMVLMTAYTYHYEPGLFVIGVFLTAFIAQEALNERIGDK